MKTRLDILVDIEDELCVRLPIDILPSDTNFNDKWFSEEEIKQVLYNINMSDELRNQILEELLGETK
jgi:hypothetical protein